jgi:hypothetical protein
MIALGIVSLLNQPPSIRIEDLLIEAIKDLAKVGMKRYSMQKLDENPKLRAEVRMKDTHAPMPLRKLTP